MSLIYPNFANAYVAAYHRHHGQVRGHRFSLGFLGELGLHGAVIAEGPVARLLDEGMSTEVTRFCTDSTPNNAERGQRAPRRGPARGAGNGLPPHRDLHPSG
jgi:hypothetical protein